MTGNSIKDILQKDLILPLSAGAQVEVFYFQ